MEQEPFRIVQVSSIHQTLEISPSFRPFFLEALLILEMNSPPSSECSRVRASERLFPLRWYVCEKKNKNRTKMFPKPSQKITQIWMEVFLNFFFYHDPCVSVTAMMKIPSGENLQTNKNGPN